MFHRCLEAAGDSFRLGYVRLEPMGKVFLKGKKEPVKLWILHESVMSATMEHIRNSSCFCDIT